MAKHLRIQFYEVVLAAEARARLPGSLASPLRGALGPALKAEACIEGGRCSGCARPDACAYGAVFEARSAATGHAWHGTIPRPMWIEEDRSTPRQFRRGDRWSVRLAAVGSAIAWAPTLERALARAGRRGIGGRRLPFRLERFIAASPWPGFPPGPAGIEECRARARTLSGPDRRVAVRFRSPLRLKVAGRLAVEAPALEALVRAATTRANGLSVAFCGGTWDSELAALRDAARGAHVESQRVTWRSVQRYSSRREAADSLGGLVGEVVYAGVAEEALVGVALAELLHVGADTVMGCGRVEVVPAPRQISQDLDAASLELARNLVERRARAIAGRVIARVDVQSTNPARLCVRYRPGAADVRELRDAMDSLSEEFGISIEVGRGAGLPSARVELET